MPGNAMVYYAGWGNLWYLVNIDFNGGETPAGASSYFWEMYNGTVEEYGNVSRNYFASDNGTYYYWYDAETRAYYYSETDQARGGAADTKVSEQKYKYLDGAYIFKGWIDRATGEAYNFDSLIGAVATEPSSQGAAAELTIVAQWLKTGTYELGFYLGEEIDGAVVATLDEDGNMIPVYSDGKGYADGASVIAPMTMDSTYIPAGKKLSGWEIENKQKVALGEMFELDSATMDLDGDNTIRSCI